MVYAFYSKEMFPRAWTLFKYYKFSEFQSQLGTMNDFLLLFLLFSLKLSILCWSVAD